MDSELSSAEIDARLQTFFGGERGTAGHSHLGADLVGCGLCGTPLNAHRYYATQYTQTQVVYRCRTQDGGCGEMSVGVDVVDALLRDFTVERLADPRLTPQRVAVQVAARLARVRKSLAEVQQTVGYCTDRKKRKGLRKYFQYRYRLTKSGADQLIDSMIDSMNQEIARLSADQDTLAAGGTTSDIHAEAVPASVLAVQWEEAGVHEQRDLLTAALGGDRVVFDPGATQLRIVSTG